MLIFEPCAQDEAWQELASLVTLGYRPGPEQYRHLVRAEAATGKAQLLLLCVWSACSSCCVIGQAPVSYYQYVVMVKYHMCGWQGCSSW